MEKNNSEMEEIMKNLTDKTLKHKYYDRQMRIPNWDQELISQQVCFCLGVGGLGSTVAMDLCRLGVKKIFLLDYDVVDSHNLNRQMLYGIEDIDKPKVKQASKALDLREKMTTEIVEMDMDALQNWNKIITAAKECNVIFNMIDVGTSWDLAVQSLCLSLKIPHVSGGTFQNSITVDFFGPHGNPCFLCASPSNEKQIVEKLSPDLIQSYDKIDFIKKEINPIGASNAMVASTCAHMMVNNFIQNLLGNEIPNRLIFNYLNYDLDKWIMDGEKDCPFCSKNLK
eukprot:gene11097-3804_t